MAKRTVKDIEEHGDGNPAYDINSPQLAKFRAVANKNGSVMELERFYRVQYANAVEQAVLAAQRAALAPRREVVFSAGCASGTFHNDGESISKAVRSQHRAALTAYPAKVRRSRTILEWKQMYEEAMHEKRQRILRKAAAFLEQDGGNNG